MITAVLIYTATYEYIGNPRSDISVQVVRRSLYCMSNLTQTEHIDSVFFYHNYSSEPNLDSIGGTNSDEVRKQVRAAVCRQETGQSSSLSSSSTP